MTPAVKDLQVHLPNQQMQYFQADQEQQAAVLVPSTQLTAWLQHDTDNAIDDPNCRTFLYADVPSQYTTYSGTELQVRRK